MSSFFKPLVSFLFGLFASAYIWIRNDMSDRWIVIFFATIVANQLIDATHSLTLNNVNINNYLTIVSFVLFLIHPLINMLGSYTEHKDNMFFEPMILAVTFASYMIFKNYRLFGNFKTIYKNGYISTWTENLTIFDLGAYLVLLLFPMYLYNPPKNIFMMFSSLFLLLLSYFIDNKGIQNIIPYWHSLMIGLLGANILFF